jgi:hypothetical protein
MSTMRTTTATILTGIRRHPGRALAICVPLAAAGIFAGTSAASAGPQATLAVSQAQLHARPAPFIMNFDGAMPGTHVVANKSDRPVPEPANITGCDYDYGQASQCVPWQIPASTPQAKCGWLQANGFGPLKVVGVNRQHLPENAHGYVCAGAS